MSFKSGCDISGKVVMTMLQWVQCLIEGCDVMPEVDVKSQILLLGVIGCMLCHLQCKECHTYASVVTSTQSVVMSHFVDILSKTYGI